MYLGGVTRSTATKDTEHHNIAAWIWTFTWVREASNILAASLLVVDNGRPSFLHAYKTYRLNINALSERSSAQEAHSWSHYLIPNKRISPISLVTLSLPTTEKRRETLGRRLTPSPQSPYTILHQGSCPMSSFTLPSAFNPLTPKIWLSILPSTCYTFPFKLVKSICC